MNIVLGLGLLLVSFIGVLLFYRWFGKSGVFAWIAIATILANIQVVKTVEIFGLTATLGNVLYGSIFLATDVLNEHYGEKVANKSVLLGFLSAIVMLASMQLAIAFIPASSDIATGALKTIFDPAIRIVTGSLVAYLVSQFLDVRLFQVIKKKYPSDKYLWLRNNGATLISQLLDTAIFVSIAFIGVYPMSIVLQIYLTTYVFKAIIALLDTPFIYLSKKIKPSE